MAKSKGAKTKAEEVSVVSYKGFDAKLQCRGYQFEVGKTYEHQGHVKACESGFHACEHPLNVFAYYRPAQSRYARVTQSGTLARHDGDTKIASAKITIDAEIKLPEIIATAVKYVFDRAKWKDGPVATGANEGALSKDKNGAATASGYSGAATASGNYGAATASGDYGAATASGNSGAATASGDYGAATASGNYGAATASGDYGAATASGYSGHASALGRNGKAKAKEGASICLRYLDDNYKLIHVWAGIAGQSGIKPDTFYRLNSDGKPVEVA